MVVDSSFLLCYASQKGTAQSIAEDISEQCSSHDLPAACYVKCISELTSIDELKQFLCVVFVGSTTGDGDPPETAQKFMRRLRSLEDDYPWLYYTVLGLGDTNYTNFCNFGKTLDKALQKIKAQRFYECGWADDGTGLEIVVEPWIEGLIPSLKGHLSSTQLNRKEVELTCEEIKCNSHSETICESVEIQSESNLTSVNEMANESVAELSIFFPSLNLSPVTDSCSHPITKCAFDLETGLSIPILPSPFLLITFTETTISKNEWKAIAINFPYPLAASEVLPCHITKCQQMTTNKAVKRTLELHLEPISEEPLNYEPGDSFGILVENVEDEVNLLLHRLKLTDVADCKIQLSVDPNTKKKAASIPKFIPAESSLRYIFTHCLDIRTIPKKTFLRSLVDCTHEFSEKRRLMELVSKEGSEEYNKFVRSQGLTFLDLLLFFPSCQPSVSVVLEHLQRLLPRPYSITSTPLLQSNSLSFVFNVIEIPKGGSIAFERKGLCTGMLDAKAKEIQLVSETHQEPLETKFENLKLDKKENIISIYFRTNQNFRLPSEVSTPLIMIGPGTGVAPFVGFLKHREAQTRSGTDKPPFTWLFFGCRHKDRDFLFREDLEGLKESGTLTRLSVSFSRDEKEEGEPKYVQDNLNIHGEEVIDQIHNHNAAVYVCGDAKNMSKSVLDTFISLLQKHLQLDEMDAKRYIAQMQMKQRYLQDVWA